MTDHTTLGWGPRTVQSFHEHSNLTTRQLSDLLGVSGQTLEAWRTGTSIPCGGAQTLLNILANAYGFIDYRVRKTPLDVLRLSSRAQNCLVRANYCTVEQVAVLGDVELLAIRNLGAKTLDEIKHKLSTYLPRYPLVFEGLTPNLAQVSSGTSLSVLDLSLRAQERLFAAGCTTVGDVALLSQPQLFAVTRFDARILTEIQETLSAYGVSNTTDRKASPRERIPKGQPLDVLDLSARAYNCLRRAGYKTVNQVAGLSDTELSEIHFVGQKTLEEIKKKLAAYLEAITRGSAGKQTEVPPITFPTELFRHGYLLGPPPLVDPQILDRVQQRGIPIASISTDRLELGHSCRLQLESEGIETIGELASEPYDKWRRNLPIRRKLDLYLRCLIEEEETVWAKEVAGDGLSLLHRRALAKVTLEQLVQDWLSDLPSRQRKVLGWRYGLYSESLTLSEVGEQQLELTRERVRQIQVEAERGLVNPIRRRRIGPLIGLVSYLLEAAGGLLNEEQIDSALRQEIAIGNISSAPVVHMIAKIYGAFSWLRETKAFGLPSFPLNKVGDVHRCLAHILESRYVPLSGGLIISEFKKSSFYDKHRSQLSDDFIEACLSVHPNIVESSEKGVYGLRKWETRHTDEIVLALQEIGEPAHYSEITERVHSLLDGEMEASERNIHAILQRRSDLFVRVGHGIYGLRRWGLPDDGSVANAAVRVLMEAGKPLHHETISNLVLETWHVNPNSVYMAVNSDARFVNIGRGVYWLREMLSELPETDAGADFGDLFGDRLTRWQEELDRLELPADEQYDTHSEVDAIAEAGLDLFSD